MNGSQSPAPPSNGVGDAITNNPPPNCNGRRSPEPGQNAADGKPQQSQYQSAKEEATVSVKATETKDEAMIDAPREPKLVSSHDGVDDDAASEAETLITSPVKKRETEKQNTIIVAPGLVKKESSPQHHRVPAPRHRIGSLPVPTDVDDEVDSTASPVTSTETDAAKSNTVSGVSGPTTKREEPANRVGDGVVSDKDDDDNDDDGSDSLSSVQSDPPSRASSPRSRAASERPNYSRNGAHSPNPRKRKHRASSVSLPNKRLGVDIPKQRRLRGLHSEELASRSEQSPSPKLRNTHRRAVSTQSAFMDGSSEHQNRKRRAATQGLGREPKMGKNGWEESDASSETTSHGHPESRRPTRGIGRSTSTPGRPPGREHKRHVNKYGFTRLAEACESGELDLVKDWREKDPDQLELAEFAGNKPLQIAALNGNVEVVDYLIDQGCQIDCANVDKDTPLIDAAENGHLDVVQSLLRAGVDPLRQNLKGQQALDVVTDETDDADEIRSVIRKFIDQWNSDGAKQRREEEEELRHRAGSTTRLHFMARTYENLIHLVQNNDRTGVKEFMDARVPVDNAVIAAAAKTGDLYLVNMLLAEMTEKKAYQKPEKPMQAVLGTSHFEMVTALTELDQFNPLYKNRQGLSWAEIAEQRNGPNRRQEVQLLQKLRDERLASKQRRSSSPVLKRDNGKRRPAEADNEDSDDEEAPKRKNGRRLMSKRDMRAASGKAASDSSSEDSDSEMANGPEANEERSMKPPESPHSRRGPSRPRTKSMSAHSSDASPESRRRRSSSLRADQSLPTVDEKAEAKEPGNRAQEEHEKRSAEEAQRLEAIRRRDEEAEAAAKRALEEEAARQAEEERKADEIRQREEERRAEEARKAERERKRVEAEMAEAQRVHREGVVASLPRAVTRVLNPQSPFDYTCESALSYLVHHFTPLQVVRHEHQDPYGSFNEGPDAPFWVVNVQAAPLLGQQGMELMIRSDIPGYKGSLADAWETKDVKTEEVARIESMLTNLPDDLPLPLPDVDEDGLPLLSFREELHRASEREDSFAKVKERLRNGDVTLRYVRLDDVFRHLHPALRSAQIDVRFDYLTCNATRLLGDKEHVDFVERLGGFLERRPRPRTYINGKVLEVEAANALGSTQVRVIEAK